jgi:hypothetical protein
MVRSLIAGRGFEQEALPDAALRSDENEILRAIGLSELTGSSAPPAPAVPGQMSFRPRLRATAQRASRGGSLCSPPVRPAATQAPRSRKRARASACPSPCRRIRETNRVCGLPGARGVTVSAAGRRRERHIRPGCARGGSTAEDHKVLEDLATVRARAGRRVSKAMRKGGRTSGARGSAHSPPGPSNQHALPNFADVRRRPLAPSKMGGRSRRCFRAAMTIAATRCRQVAAECC